MPFKRFFYPLMHILRCPVLICIHKYKMNIYKFLQYMQYTSYLNQTDFWCHSDISILCIFFILYSPFSRLYIITWFSSSGESPRKSDSRQEYKMHWILTFLWSRKVKNISLLRVKGDFGWTNAINKTIKTTVSPFSLQPIITCFIYINKCKIPGS